MRPLTSQDITQRRIWKVYIFYFYSIILKMYIKRPVILSINPPPKKKKRKKKEKQQQQQKNPKQQQKNKQTKKLMIKTTFGSIFITFLLLYR